MPDNPGYQRGGILPAALVPIRLHPDECVVRADEQPWRCIRAEHRDRLCQTGVQRQAH